MTSCPAAMGWDSQWFWKKAVSWDLDLGEASWFFRTWQGQGSLWTVGCMRVGWVSELRADDGRTVSIEKIVSLSPRVEKPKLKKGDKSFVPEPRELSVFRVFQIPMPMNIMNVLYIHIFTYSHFWICYISMIISNKFNRNTHIHTHTNIHIHIYK